MYDTSPIIHKELNDLFLVLFLPFCENFINWNALTDDISYIETKFEFDLLG